MNMELLRAYPDSFGKPAYISVPPAVGAAMGDEPGNLKLCKGDAQMLQQQLKILCILCIACS